MLKKWCRNTDDNTDDNLIPVMPLKPVNVRSNSKKPKKTKSRSSSKSRSISPSKSKKTKSRSSSKSRSISSSKPLYPHPVESPMPSGWVTEGIDNEEYIKQIEDKYACINLKEKWENLGPHMQKQEKRKFLKKNFPDTNRVALGKIFCKLYGTTKADKNKIFESVVMEDYGHRFMNYEKKLAFLKILYGNSLIRDLVEQIINTEPTSHGRYVDGRAI
jgi:hypothetical protein